MTASRENCGLTFLLPMSCRERAEAFARHLHSRLRTLGSQDANGVPNENSWLAAHENSITLSQPRHTTDLSSESDLYLDFGSLESPGSPETEVDGVELEKVINKDSLILFHNSDCHCSIPNKDKLLNNVRSLSHDSDSSEEQFFDLNQQTEVELYDVDKTDQEMVTAECSLSETTSTTDIKDEDYFLECNNCFPPLFNHDELQLSDIKCDTADDNETYTTCLTIEKELTIECPKEVQILVTPSQQYLSVESTNSIQENLNGDDDAILEEKIPPVRRCSSLKTGKTPPGTPSRKKIVRFADVLGLDLADVRTFLDEIPKIPNSAYNDLRDVDIKNSASESTLNTPLKLNDVKIDKMLVPLFQQPGGQPDFLAKIRDNQVCLDSALVEDPLLLTISGIIRVKNLDFHKTVHIRYTLDSWHTFADVQSTYVENSCDGFSDKFSFLIFANSLSVGQKLEFAIRFQCKGYQYWDNNNGKNYCFQCLPTTHNTSCTPMTIADDSWATSFY
jgi:hypothetical protein